MAVSKKYQDYINLNNNGRYSNLVSDMANSRTSYRDEAEDYGYDFKDKYGFKGDPLTADLFRFNIEVPEDVAYQDVISKQATKAANHAYDVRKTFLKSPAGKAEKHLSHDQVLHLSPLYQGLKNIKMNFELLDLDQNKSYDQIADNVNHAKALVELHNGTPTKDEKSYMNQFMKDPTHHHKWANEVAEYAQAVKNDDASCREEYSSRHKDISKSQNVSKSSQIDSYKDEPDEIEKAIHEGGKELKASLNKNKSSFDKSKIMSPSFKQAIEDANYPHFDSMKNETPVNKNSIHINVHPVSLNQHRDFDGDAKHSYNDINKTVNPKFDHLANETKVNNSLNQNDKPDFDKSVKVTNKVDNHDTFDHNRIHFTKPVKNIAKTQNHTNKPLTVASISKVSDKYVDDQSINKDKYPLDVNSEQSLEQGLNQVKSGQVQPQNYERAVMKAAIKHPNIQTGQQMRRGLNAAHKMNAFVSVTPHGQVKLNQRRSIQNHKQKHADTGLELG